MAFHIIAIVLPITTVKTHILLPDYYWCGRKEEAILYYTQIIKYLNLYNQYCLIIYTLG